MATSRALNELEQILTFLRRTDEGASTSVHPLPFGIAYFHEELPRVYDRNFALVTPDGDRLDARSLIGTLDEVQGGAGLAHRKAVFEDEAVGKRLVAALSDAGWEHRRLAVMAYRGRSKSASQRPSATLASEVDRRALLPALEAMIRSEPWGSDEEVVRQLSAADVAIERAVRQRCFARLVNGKVVSSCRLYSDGSIAQIEDVATIPGHRQRGYAETVVTTAVEEALPEHDLLFLTVVDGRWVKQWYERLGFEQVGLRYDATRTA